MSSNGQLDQAIFGLVESLIARGVSIWRRSQENTNGTFSSESARNTMQTKPKTCVGARLLRSCWCDRGRHRHRHGNTNTAVRPAQAHARARTHALLVEDKIALVGSATLLRRILGKLLRPLRLPRSCGGEPVRPMCNARACEPGRHGSLQQEPQGYDLHAASCFHLAPASAQDVERCTC
eukprot:358782-Amphidinium_carterae.1